ncbi:MAG: Unknown protein [uncultured Thiotrichaceae bacterium]|uniref:FAD assembly factor SdhE n=1 Tax=uncultured Thiotrichaceae bacterium TaxID=298394 RepID=A0A6S6T5N1_9GAMM|nr:MAG: Unknown protein [uncultured Thiotrichaceae bacterium]
MSELSHLKWRCRRGTKELDLIMNKYLDEHYADPNSSADEASRGAFKELLNLEDPTLYAMLLGDIEGENAAQIALLQTLRDMNSVSK